MPQNEKTEPVVDAIEKLAGRLDASLASSVRRWMEAGDHGLESWQDMLRRELESTVFYHLASTYSKDLQRRGILPTSKKEAKRIATMVLEDTDDLRKRVLNAPVESVQAAFFRDTLMSALHQNRIIQSIVRRAQDLFGIASIDDDPQGFTGRRRWRTSVVSSRHRDLNFQIAESGENFQVGPYSWFGPRGDITAASQASGCRCYLEFERTDGSWV